MELTHAELVEQLQRQIAQDEAAVENARAEVQRIQKTLNRSRRIRNDALPKLQRAGRVR